MLLVIAVAAFVARYGRQQANALVIAQCVGRKAEFFAYFCNVHVWSPREISRALSGQDFIGAAYGYAPADVDNGVNNGKNCCALQ